MCFETQLPKLGIQQNLIGIKISMYRCYPKDLDPK